MANLSLHRNRHHKNVESTHELQQIFIETRHSTCNYITNYNYHVSKVQIDTRWNAHDFTLYFGCAFNRLIARETSHNRSSHTVNHSNLPWSSLVKYPYDKFKSGKIIFKEFFTLALSRASPLCTLSFIST